MREVAGLGVARVRETVSSRDTLIVLVRATGKASASTPDSGLTLRALGPGDADLYARDIGTDSPATFTSRLTESNACYVVEEGDAVLHASWVTTGCAWTRELRADLCVGSGDAYVYESFTRADARGRGVYPFALYEMCAALKRQDVARLWVAVEAHNVPSLRAVAKAGFERAFEIGYARRLGRLVVELPNGVKTDTRVTRARKKRCIWLTRDGAIQQWGR